MQPEDLAQVTEIDREAFPTQLPLADYRNELKNRLSHYIVICDADKAAAEPGTPAPATGTGRLKQLLKRPFLTKPSPLNRDYIIGFAGIWLLAEDAHITNIAVRQEYQRRGIGELLLLSIIKLAKKLKARLVTLEVRASNTTAQNLYSKHGFTRVGIRKGYYTDNGEDAVLMTTKGISLGTFEPQIRQLQRIYRIKER